MGQVFLARDTFLDRIVALKLLLTTESAASVRDRFYTEARAVARLQHPNVVTLYRAGETDGKLYLVSEYVTGKSLDREKHPMPWQRVLQLGLGIARGLAAAHQSKVLHRDIKPANVMCTDDPSQNDPENGIAATAVSVTFVPTGTSIVQFAPQFNPAGLEVTIP